MLDVILKYFLKGSVSLVRGYGSGCGSGFGSGFFYYHEKLMVKTLNPTIL
jgi:hypothetical protein